MKITSWNVNSLKVRLDQVLEWINANQPDVLGLQETKLKDENFPVEAIEAAGYHSAFSGQATYNGVALLSREPAEDVVEKIPGFEDPHRRVIAGTFNDVRVINLYVVNGKAVGDEKYEWKLQWLEAVTRWIAEETKTHDKLVVVGDFNIAPQDRDVHDPEAWHEKILCSTPERTALENMMTLGLTDTYRLFDQPERVYSWYDYRQMAFRRKMGLRIDLVLASKPMAEKCTASDIDLEPRRNERPSDHAPVSAVFSL
ncbi:MAG TPA: exodeoxyribonuclease III [Wenzhouxiangellaceae bacterium]|nr:exodeoxyribonuclease III [Wenzhouxiangellaceae bacterium]